MAASLADRIDEANREAHRRIIAGEPVLVDVQSASQVIPNFPERTILHAGPPINWDRMCGPMQGAVAGAIVFEGWAADLEQATALAASGKVNFQPRSAGSSTRARPPSSVSMTRRQAPSSRR